MALTKSLTEITEWRGVEGLVAAEVLIDDNESPTEGVETPDHGYVTGNVFAVAGVAEIEKTVDSTEEAHYYDNFPAIVISSDSEDTITISTSALPTEVYATLTGQVFDEATGSLIEGEREVKYFALGYKTSKTNGDEVYVWRYKGMFGIPGSTHATKDRGTDANGQELTYTGIKTNHKFVKAKNKGAKALNVDLGLGKADVSNFFDSVVTPDQLQAKSTTD